MKRAIQKNLRYFAVLVAIMVTGTLLMGVVLVKERLRLPFTQAYTIKAEFETSAGLLPGLGQAVNVAGVKVGTVSGAKFGNGHSVVSLEIRPGKLKHVYANAHATMVPNSPVKDLVVELDPGHPPARALHDGGTIPVGQTTSQVELDELWAALDTDTRQYFSALVAGLGRGLHGRGNDFRAVFKNLGPTAQELQPVMHALAQRRIELRHAVHNLAAVTSAAGTQDRQLARSIVDANVTLQTIGAQQAALRASLVRLPPTLAALRTSLGHTTSFANELGPAMRALLPTARRLPAALAATRPLLDVTEPVVRTQLRPFVRDAQPIAGALRPAVVNLNKVTPSLSDAFRVLTYVVNELAYNPPGDDEGFLFWMAWFFHNANSFLANEDANGSMWRGVLVTDCRTLTKATPALQQVMSALLPTTC
jgi:phospholipid/cholesterol/gamma-HCH transport system substrate-binding protein